MRDRCFVAVHRGSTLDLARHRLLALCAADCAARLLPLFTQVIDEVCDEARQLFIATWSHKVTPAP